MAHLYGDKAAYLHRCEKSLDQAISGRYILPQDGAGFMAQAEPFQFSALYPIGFATLLPCSTGYGSLPP